MIRSALWKIILNDSYFFAGRPVDTDRFDEQVCQSYIGSFW